MLKGLTGHRRKNKNLLLKTGDPITQVHLHCVFVKVIQKMWLLNPIALRNAKIVYNFGLSECNSVKTGDPLIEVTTQPGLTVFCLYLHRRQAFLPRLFYIYDGASLSCLMFYKSVS